MGLRHHRSGRLFEDVWFKSAFGSPGSGIALRQSSNGSGQYLLGAAILVAIAAIVWLLP